MKNDYFQGGEAALEELLKILIANKYEVCGPQVRDNDAIVYDQMTDFSKWPRGLTDNQIAGKYQLLQRNDNAYFGFNVGPNSWKKYLFPAKEKLWSVQRKNKNEILINKETVEPPLRAFLGVRSCDVHAIRAQDKIFMQMQYSDKAYVGRRKKSLIIGINCGQAQATCFCTTMGGSPKITDGVDIIITEEVKVNESEFYFQGISDLGKNLLSQMSSLRPIDRIKVETIAESITAVAVQQMQIKFDNTKVKDVLYASHESPLWEAVADRCLSCANCTIVCPTCFCSTIEDVSDLKGENADRWRKWESCFTADHSNVHGGSVRTSTKSRYRQWITHKLASWWDQFEMSGCTGCGRCVTWCPVGIDITEEARKLIQEKSQQE
jgi:formate hydrogenlyase subunit 6/NADH:ubiquinone oxidoreductase subunit I